MSAELRALDPQNLQDAIDVMNRSSRGTSLAYDLDIFGFRWLARYWNFSYEHSRICYVEDEPAALMLNCIDPDAHDAYTFYWGALPRFRHGRISLSLVEACCRKLYEDGYAMHYAVALPDRPVSRYRFVQFKPQCDLVDMQAQSPSLPTVDSRFEVRAVGVDDLPQLALPPGEYLHWCQRYAFLRRAAPFLKFLASFAGHEMKAYAVVLAQFPNTTLSDLRSAESCSAAGYELLRWLLVHDYRPPLTATHVLEQSYAHRLLTASGFAVTRQFSVLFRNLHATLGAQPDQ
jgi:hypothetical protein